MKNCALIKINNKFFNKDFQFIKIFVINLLNKFSKNLYIKL